MSVRKCAEILAIEVSIDGKKFVFCTVYRVGNLDEPNHASIMSTIKTFYKIRNPRKIFIVGDFNLKSISWPRSEDMGNGNGTDKLFVDSFNGFGLDQCISGPTNNKGRTLDLMLTNSRNFVTEIIVSPDCYLCKSDHYLLTFEVRSNVKRNKVPRHIEIRAHKKFKNYSRIEGNTQNIIQSEINFKHKRQLFKNICSKKMRDNLYNGDDPGLITKKLWSHVKSNSKSSRLPETMHLDDTFRNKPSEKAELFNNYFYEQFSGRSNYNTHIDFSNDQVFDIDFNRNRVYKHLSNINSNKASGPDGIHGKIFKNCSESLAYPLSLILKVSYNTGSLPNEWKLANVVPIHKKGGKDDIKNYRPISLTCLVMKLFERILKEELLLRTSHLLDSRQHGFLNLKSCSTNMISFTDNVVLSINDTRTLSTDVVYFDFSKAFDSVNHDLILDKLKNSYSIDGRLLKILKNYLCEREQSVVLDGVKSSSKPVLSFTCNIFAPYPRNYSMLNSIN